MAATNDKRNLYYHRQFEPFLDYELITGEVGEESLRKLQEKSSMKLDGPKCWQVEWFVVADQYQD